MLGFGKMTGNPDIKKKALKFQKMNDRVLGFINLFRPFYSNDWCFETKNIFMILNSLSEEEKEIFNCNVKTIDWI
jgi:hypothetical protein